MTRPQVTTDCERALNDDVVFCDVCEDTGEVLDAPGRAGRQIMPCLSCDAYDRLLCQREDALAEMMED